MNSIIWLVNPAEFKEEDILFPAYLVKNGRHRLAVVFLNELEPREVPVVSNDPVFPTTNYTIPPVDIYGDASGLAEEVRERIHNAARREGISLYFPVSPEEGSVLEQSRFADLVLLNANLSYGSGNESPSEFVMDLLPKMQCPVMIMPDGLQEIHEIYLAYNGSYSSMYAIRQLNYLFPEFSRLPVTVIYVEEGGIGIPFEKSLKEYLRNNYVNFTIRLLRGDPASALMDELMMKKNILVTLGAFGRNRASRFFRQSNAEGIFKVINIPVFVTHP